MNRSYFVDLSLIAVAVIWALNFSVVKVTLEQMDALSFNGIRYIFAALLLVFALIRSGEKFRFERKDWLPLLGMAMIGNLLYQVLFIVGIDLTLTANAAVMLGTIPVWVALLSHLFTDEKLIWIKGIGVLTAFSGVFLIIIGGRNPLSFESSTFLGDLICLFAAMVWAIYTILSKRFLKTYSPTQYSTLMAGIGSILLLAVGMPTIVKIDWTILSPGAYAGIIYSGALSVGLAYLIWNNGLVKIGAVRTATYQNLVPVLGLLFGVILLNEDLTLMQYVGALFVIIGIILSRKQ